MHVFSSYSLSKGVYHNLTKEHSWVKKPYMYISFFPCMLTIEGYKGAFFPL